MKARQFAIGGAQVKQTQADRAKNNVRRPATDPRRDAVTFAERQKKMGQKIHREDEKNRARHAGENAAARETNS